MNRDVDWFLMFDLFSYRESSRKILRRNVSLLPNKTEIELKMM